MTTKPTTRDPVYTLDRTSPPAKSWQALMAEHVGTEEIVTVECHAVVETFCAIKLPPRIIDPDGDERMISGSKLKCEMALTAWDMEQKILTILDDHYPQPGAAMGWLKQPRPQFDQRTAADLIRDGQTKRVLDTLIHLSNQAIG